MGAYMTINPNSQVITLSTLTSDKAVESSVLNGMFVKGHYSRPNDENRVIVPISTIKDSINKQMMKAKKSYTLPTPEKVIELSGGLTIKQSTGLNWLQPAR
jgi:hypothetical protein